MKRLDLAEVVLTLKASGVEDIANFRWLEPPEPQALARAEQLLVDLGALSGGKTRRRSHHSGAGCCAFPVHPRYARMLLAAEEYRCVRAIALIAALTQGRGICSAARTAKQAREDRDDLFGSDDDSDLFILMRAFRFAEKNNFDPRRCARLSINAAAAREAGQLWEQFLAIARDEGLEVGEREVKSPARSSAASSPVFRIRWRRAWMLGTLRCALVHGRRGVLARESAVHRARLLVASEIREIESSDKERQVLLTLATRIEEELAAGTYSRKRFRKRRGGLRCGSSPRERACARQRFHDLVLRSERRGSSGSRGRGDCSPAKWSPAPVRSRIGTTRSSNGSCGSIASATWFPELAMPTIDEAEKLLMLEEICRDAVSYKEIKDRPVWPAVKSWLTRRNNSSPSSNWRRSASSCRTVAEGQNHLPRSSPPTVAARIQDLYGVERNLTIGRGRVPLVIQVLAPNHRPIQITSDLERFWRDAYPKIKKELQRKYPKHEWR